MIDRRRTADWAVTRTQAAGMLMALLPGAVTLYLAFNAGGFFVGATAVATTVLLFVLAARIMLAADPAAGVSRDLLVAAGALAAFALWTLVSGLWSEAPWRALSEFDRVLLYLIALLLFGSLGGGAARLRWMIRGVTLAVVAVCAVSLTARVLPGLWPIPYESLARRLDYPVTYSNALGLLASIGAILCFGMTCSERESRIVRVLACGAIPLLGSTLLFTLSRGAILAAVIGLVAFALIGHTRALLSGLLATGPATIIALAYAYRSDLLVPEDPLARAALDQGEAAAIVIGLCVVGAALVRALLLRLDAVLDGVQLAQRVRRRMLTAGVVAVAVVLAATAVAADVPRQYDRFMRADATTTTNPRTDPRARLSDPSGERITYWRVASQQFERTPVRGSGAGTYGIVWDQHRSALKFVRDGHSLYLETLSELGLIGAGLIVFAILAMLLGIARRIRARDRATYATAFAASFAWAIAAGFDWHWEMAVVTLWFFALGGAALASERKEGSARIPPLWLRTAVAGACCVLALLVPLRVAVSQDRLEASLDAFVVGKCDTAKAAGRDSLRAIASRPQPYEVLAYCALVDGNRTLASTRMREALHRDPNSWSLHYGLARLQAMAGRDPRRAAHDALRLNPLDPLTRDAVKRFAGLQRPSQWRRAAQGMEIILPEP